MDRLKIIIGVLILAVAWLVLYRAKIIYAFNAWMRTRVFSDELVLFSGRRVALLLAILGGVALFSGLEGLIDVIPIRTNIANEMMIQAQAEWRAGRYIRTINICRELIRSTPKNVEAWELLAHSSWAVGNKTLAVQALDSVLRLNPEHPLRHSAIAHYRGQSLVPDELTHD